MGKPNEQEVVGSDPGTGEDVVASGTESGMHIEEQPTQSEIDFAEAEAKPEAEDAVEAMEETGATVEEAAESWTDAEADQAAEEGDGHSN